MTGELGDVATAELMHCYMHELPCMAGHEVAQAGCNWFVE